MHPYRSMATTAASSARADAPALPPWPPPPLGERALAGALDLAVEDPGKGSCAAHSGQFEGISTRGGGTEAALTTSKQPQAPHQEPLRPDPSMEPLSAATFSAHTPPSSNSATAAAAVDTVPRSGVEWLALAHLRRLTIEIGDPPPRARTLPGRSSGVAVPESASEAWGRAETLLVAELRSAVAAVSVMPPAVAGRPAAGLPLAPFAPDDCGADPAGSLGAPASELLARFGGLPHAVRDGRQQLLLRQQREGHAPSGPLITVRTAMQNLVVGFPFSPSSPPPLPSPLPDSPPWRLLSTSSLDPIAFLAIVVFVAVLAHSCPHHGAPLRSPLGSPTLTFPTCI